MEFHILVSAILGLVVNAVGKHLDIRSSEHCQIYVEYFNAKSGACEICTMCTDNDVVLRPCTATEDTLCGPMDFDANVFLQYEKGFEAADESTPAPRIRISVESEHHQGAVPVELLSDKWYKVSMVMLGILSFVCIGIVIYVGLACFVCKKKSSDKEIIYQAGMCPILIFTIVLLFHSIFKNNGLIPLLYQFSPELFLERLSTIFLKVILYFRKLSMRYNLEAMVITRT